MQKKFDDCVHCSSCHNLDKFRNTCKKCHYSGFLTNDGKPSTVLFGETEKWKREQDAAKRKKKKKTGSDVSGR